MQLSNQYGWGWSNWKSKPCEQQQQQQKKGNNWGVTVQIELFLKNWSRRAWNKGLEPSCAVLHVLYGHSCVLQRPFTRLLLPPFMYFGIERNGLPQFLAFIFQLWLSTRMKKKKKEKYWNNETVTMVSFKCSSALQVTPFIPQINGCQGVAPPLFFLKEKNSFGERT